MNNIIRRLIGKEPDSPELPKHRDFVIFLYSIFFGRKPENGAIEHWTRLLSGGVSYEELFESFWNSEEFKDKAPYSSYFRAPPNRVKDGATECPVITQQYLSEIIEFLKCNPSKLLEVSSIRSWLAIRRYQELISRKDVKRLLENDFIIPGTVSYNEKTLESYVGLDRSAALVQPLLSIGRIAENVSRLKILSVGPRTEMELFAILAAGFRLENIELIDLLSYSPYFRLADMHNMPFADDSFDVALLGFVLGYSATPDVAVREVRRVVKHRGVISIGHSRQKKSPTNKIDISAATADLRPTFGVQTSTDLIEFFQPKIGQIFFRAEAEEPLTQFTDRIIAIFEITKSE